MARHAALAGPALDQLDGGARIVAGVRDLEWRGHPVHVGVPPDLDGAGRLHKIGADCSIGAGNAVAAQGAVRVVCHLSVSAPDLREAPGVSIG